MTRSTIICISLVIVSLMFAGPSYAKVDPATILGAWLLDEGTGNTAEDASGNGNDGTIVGSPAWVAGQSGSALQFTGSGTYVNCGNAASLNVGVFSVSFWYNFPSTQSWNHMISRGQHVASGTPGSVNWGIMMYSAEQRILFETYNNTGWTGISADSTAGVWHHVVATYDGSTMQLYHDGQLAGTANAGILLDPSRAFVIGGRSDAGSVGGLFNGSLDEVGYFSAVLAPEDVQTAMTDGLAAIVGVGNPNPRRPEPKDGALVAQTWVSLSWTAGDFALSHNVYLGDNFDDVNSGAADTLRANLPQASTSFFVGLGLPGDPYPGGLVPGTTYYWRIDEVNDADPNSPWKGPVWSFFIPPRTAYDPNPSDGASFMPTDVKLAWMPGLNAKLHYVYFGDDFDTVNTATVGTPMGATTFTPPGPLALDKTYYWRVDEFDGTGTYKGDVWSFTTTIAGLGAAVMERWENISGTNLSGLKSDPRYPNSPTVTETVTQFAWNGPDTDNYGARISGWLYVPATGDYTFWLNTDDNGELWLSTDDDPANSSLIARESSYTGLNAWGTGEEQSQPISLVGAEKYYIMALWKEGTGGDHCQVAWQGPGIATRTIIPGTNISPYKPVSAYGPTPANGATSVSQNPILQWKPGVQAASHQVYFGTDVDAVLNATQTSPEYKGARTLGSESYAPGTLSWATAYYWRVDEVNNVNPSSLWVGKVWSFTTADFGIVDDFESYNDIPAGQAGSNLVYVAWLDGFGTTTNGSTIGYPTGASMETATVHGGNQSVPLLYNNSTAAFSEAERTFAAQNWTDNGIQTLSLWFYGASANLPGQLYVKINGVKVPYDGDAGNLTKPIWQVWNIELASVGVNLQSVTRLAVGIEGNGATGTLLLDDIRLYALPRQLISPVQPDPAGLVARFAFEGNANDSVAGLSGTPNGGPTYALGKIGQAISLDGVDDHVVVGSVGISGTAPRTIAGWAKASALGTPAWVNVFGFTGPSGNNGHFDIELVGDSTSGGSTLGWYGLHIYGWQKNILPIDLEWHHLAASYDGTTTKWYGDGLLVGSDNARVLNTPDNVHIGKRQDNTNYFPGSVDEVQIFNRVLSDAEIAGLAGMTKPFDKPF